jgi:predicted esterase
VILLHGINDSGQGLAGLGQYFANSLPYVKFILPTAINRPVTMFEGKQINSWYDVHGLEDKTEEPCEGITHSQARIRELLAAENVAGIPYNRMVLAGFSQGGCMSLFTGLQLPAEQKLGGLLIMSSFVPAISQFKLTSGLEDIRVFHLHGADDAVVRE